MYVKMVEEEITRYSGIPTGTRCATHTREEKKAALRPTPNEGSFLLFRPITSYVICG